MVSFVRLVAYYTSFGYLSETRFCLFEAAASILYSDIFVLGSLYIFTYLLITYLLTIGKQFCWELGFRSD